MFDLNEIRKRAQQASEQAADSMKKTLDKSQEILDGIQVPNSEDSPSVSAAQAEEQIAANTQRQVEILGHVPAGQHGSNGCQ